MCVLGVRGVGGEWSGGVRGCVGRDGCGCVCVGGWVWGGEARGSGMR